VKKWAEVKSATGSRVEEKRKGTEETAVQLLDLALLDDIKTQQLYTGFGSVLVLLAPHDRSHALTTSHPPLTLSPLFGSLFSLTLPAKAS
jgi:hypothetical protein